MTTNKSSTNLTLAEEISLFRLQASQGNIWTSFTNQFPGRTDNALKNRWFGGVRRVARVLNVDFNEASQILALFATTAGPSPIPLETYAASHHPVERISFEEPVIALGTFLTGSGNKASPPPQLATLLPAQVDTVIRAAVHRVARVRTSSPLRSTTTTTAPTNRSTAKVATTPTASAALKRHVSAIITPTSSPAPRNQRGSACWVTRNGQEVNDIDEDIPPPPPSARIFSQQQQQQQRYATPTPTASDEYVPVGLSYIDGKLTPATPRGADLIQSLARFAASCGAPAVVYWVPKTLVEGALAHSEEERNGEEGEENHTAAAASGGGEQIDEEEVGKEIAEKAEENILETSPIMMAGTTPVVDILVTSPIMMAGTTPTPPSQVIETPPAPTQT
jgi:hypothetical protein